MELTYIRYETRGRVGLITYDHPTRRNAWSVPMYREVVQAIERANADADLGAIVITNEGPVYCAGSDFKAPPEPPDPVTGRSPTIATLSMAPDDSWPHLLARSKPVIVAVSGARAVSWNPVVTAQSLAGWNAFAAANAATAAGAFAALPASTPMVNINTLGLWQKNASGSKVPVTPRAFYTPVWQIAPMNNRRGFYTAAAALPPRLPPPDRPPPSPPRCATRDRAATRTRTRSTTTCTRSRRGTRR